MELRGEAHHVRDLVGRELLVEPEPEQQLIARPQRANRSMHRSSAFGRVGRSLRIWHRAISDEQESCLIAVHFGEMPPDCCRGPELFDIVAGGGSRSAIAVPMVVQQQAARDDNQPRAEPPGARRRKRTQSAEVVAVQVI
jgi:hypothetical protein